MGDSYCNLCDKTIKYKKKHSKTKSHMYLSESIINKHYVKNPEFIEIEKILQKHVNKYNKKFEFYHIKCKWKIQFVDTTICVKSKKMYSNGSRCGLVKSS